MIKFVLLAAVLAGAVWFFAGSRGPGVVTESGPGSIARPQPPPAEVPAPGLSAAAPTARRAVSEDDAHVAPAHEALGADGLFRPLLFGRVTDMDGRPIAGARLAATWGTISVDGGPETVGLSGPDGRYQLVLPARAWHSAFVAFPGRENDATGRTDVFVFCTADGYAPVVWGQEYPHDEPETLEHAFVLERRKPSPGVRLRVLDPAGQPVHDAGVALFGVTSGQILREDDVTLWARTARDGWAEIDRLPTVAARPYALTREGLGGDGPLVQPDALAPVEVTIHMREHSGLRGTVRDTAGLSLPRARVDLIHAEERPSAEDWRSIPHSHNLSTVVRPWDGLDVSRTSVRTRYDGSFQVGHLRPGSYLARLGDGTVHGPFPIGSTVDLRMERQAAVLARVVDHEGRVLRGASLTAIGSGSSQTLGPSIDREGYRAVIGDGRLRLVAAYADAPAGWLDVELPGNAGDRIDVLVDLSAERVPVLLQAVAPGAETPPPVRFEVRRLVDDGSLQRSVGRLLSGGTALATTVPEGRWSTNLRPGRYSVHVEPTPDDAGEWLPAVSTISVSEDDAAHGITLQRGGRLRFRWSGALASSPEGLPGLVVRIRRAPDGAWRPLSRAGGAAGADGSTIRGANGKRLGPSIAKEQLGPLLLPGDYDLRLEHEGLAPVERTITVEAGRGVIADLPLDPL